MVGAKGTFKTTTLINALYSLLKYLDYYYSNIRIYVACMTQATLQEAFIDNWSDEIPATEWVRLNLYGVPHIKVGDTLIRLRYSGSSTDGMDSRRAAEKRRGGNASGWYYPQADLLTEPFFNEIDSRVRGEPIRRPGRDWYPPYKIRMADLNPGDDQYWLYTKYLQDPIVRERCIVIEIPMTTETTAFTADEIEHFKRTWPRHEVERHIYCRWVGAKGKAFHIYPHHQMPTQEWMDRTGSVRWYLSFDFGFNDDFVVGLCGYGDQRAHFADVEAMADSQSITMHEALVDTLLKRWPGIQIEGILGDPSWYYPGEGNKKKNGLKHFAELLGTNIYSVNRDRETGAQKLVEWLGTELNGIYRVTFDPEHTAYTQNSISSLVWQVFSDGRKKNDVAPGNDHGYDKARYFLMSKATEF